MNNNQTIAYFYIVSGLLLVLFFGGKSMVQVVAIMAGFLLMRQGFRMSPGSGLCEKDQKKS